MSGAGKTSRTHDSRKTPSNAPPGWLAIGVDAVRERGTRLAAAQQRGTVMSRLLGLSWNTWVRIAVASWILLFAAAWASLAVAWMSPSEGADILIAGAFIAVILAHAVPGTGALVHPSARARLRREPGAAALSSMTLAAMGGIAGFIAGTVSHEQHPMAMLGALSVGVLMFAYTFGVVFALAIPLGSGAWIWSIVRRKEEISRSAWWALTFAAALGWIVVGVAGVAFSGA